MNSRNGYRTRRWDTRAGTIDLAIPKLRKGSYFPDWLIEPRRRAERALVGVVCPVLRRGGLHAAGRRRGPLHGDRRDLEVPGLRAGQVPRRAGGGVSQPPPRRRSLHLHLGRRLDPKGQRGRPHRQRGRRSSPPASTPRGTERSWVSTSSPPRTGRAGRRSCAAWWPGDSAASPLVVSDAHGGLIDAIASVLPGAAWQRCRVHFVRNVLTRVPKAAQSMVATLIRIDLRPTRCRAGPAPARPGRRAARRARSVTPPTC